MGKFGANGRTKVVRNQFSTKEHMSKNQKTEISLAPELLD